MEQTRIKRKADLENRFKPLVVNNTYYIKAFGFRTKEIKGEIIGIHESEEIAEWDRDDLDDFVQKVLKLEAAKKEIDEETSKNKVLEDRREEYQKIDHLLFEAIAEKENGKPEKMKAYLVLREKLKKDIPKV